MAALGRALNGDFIGTLRANAEAGGDSGHRGMVLGLLLAAGSEEVPESWKTGLQDYDGLAKEIHPFARVAARGDGHLRL